MTFCDLLPYFEQFPITKTKRKPPFPARTWPKRRFFTGARLRQKANRNILPERGIAHPGWPGIPLSGICRMAAALKYGEYSARFISKQNRKAPTATRHLPPCSGFAMPRSSGRIFAFLCHSRFSRRTFVFCVARALPVPAARTLPRDGALDIPAALPGKSAFFPLKCPIRR